MPPKTVRVTFLNGKTIEVQQDNVQKVREHVSAYLKIPIGCLYLLDKDAKFIGDDLPEDLHAVVSPTGPVVVFPYFNPPYHLDIVSGIRYALPTGASSFCKGKRCIYTYEEGLVQQVDIRTGNAVQLRTNMQADGNNMAWVDDYLYLSNGHDVEQYSFPEKQAGEGVLLVEEANRPSFKKNLKLDTVLQKPKNQ